MKKSILILLILVLVVSTVGCGVIEVSSEQDAADQLFKAQSEISRVETLISKDDEEPVTISVIEKDLNRIKERIDNSEKYSISETMEERYDKTLLQYEDALEQLESLKEKRSEQGAK